jgi:hypothetical protein
MTENAPETPVNSWEQDTPLVSGDPYADGTEPAEASGGMREDLIEVPNTDGLLAEAITDVELDPVGALERVIDAESLPPATDV